MNPTVSVIVPVYNAEDYIKRCVDSILGQEYRDFELLLVNDGSTDASGSICDEYASRDKRVYVIHKANSGVSDTRNMAITHAKGTYLQFVDSDDWLTPDATKLMVRAAAEHGCDLVITDFYRVAGERVSHKGDIEEDGVMDQETFASCMMENPSDFYYGVLWNKLYRRDIVEKHHLRMDTAISWCEDFMFNLEYIRHAKSFYALRTPVYYYLKRKGSLVTQGMNISKTIKMKLMVFEYYNNFYKHVLDEEDYEKNRLQVYRFLVDSATDGIVLPALLPGSKKLGAERSGVCVDAILEDGIIMEAYRSRKLLERYLEPAALKHDLSLAEVSLLLYFNQFDRSRATGSLAMDDDDSPQDSQISHSVQPGQNRRLSQPGQFRQKGHLFSRKKLSDIMGMPRTLLSASMQRMAARGLIKVEEVREKKESKRQIRVLILPAANILLEDLAMAEKDYNQARFVGFSDRELELYTGMSERIKENIQNILQ